MKLNTDFGDYWDVESGFAAGQPRPDNKWFTRVIVAAAIIQTLDSLGLKYPEVGRDRLN